MSKKDEKDSVKRVLATGAKGDPDHPTVGAPVGAFEPEQIEPPDPEPTPVYPTPESEVHTQSKEKDK